MDITNLAKKFSDARRNLMPPIPEESGSQSLVHCLIQDLLSTESP
jgi:hypothetical protein